MPRERSAAVRALWAFAPLMAALVVEAVVFEVIGFRQKGLHFLDPANLIMVLNQAALYGIMSVGMTFVILTGGIDLTVGSLVALAGVVCAKIAQAGEAYYLVALGAGLLCGALSGGSVGALVTRFNIPPFIATLSLMSLLRGLANLLTDGRPVAGGLPQDYTLLGRGVVAGFVPAPVLVFAVVLLVAGVVLGRTRFGRHVRAIGGNEESARLSGVPVARVKLMVYAISGGLAALSGLLLSSRLGSGTPTVGLGDELSVIAAVVVGGTSLSGGRGGLAHTLVGLLIICTLTSGLNWINVGTFGQQVVLGLVILAAVLMDKYRERA